MMKGKRRGKGGRDAREERMGGRRGSGGRRGRGGVKEWRKERDWRRAGGERRRQQRAVVVLRISSVSPLFDRDPRNTPRKQTREFFCTYLVSVPNLETKHLIHI